MLGQVHLSGADGGNTITFTNASAIRRLSRQESARAYPVRLAGVVTYSDPPWGLLFIRDASAGIFVALAGGTYPTNSELVEIVGRTGGGSFLAVVAGASWKHLGAAAMPDARHITQPELHASEVDCEWSELVGVVRRVTLLNDVQNHFQIDVADRGWRTRVFLPAPEGGDPTGWDQLVDARVSALGVSGVDYDDVRGVIGFKLFVPFRTGIRVLDQPSADPFLLPCLPLAKVRGFSGTNTPVHRVHVRGIATYVYTPGELVLQEEKSAVRVLVASTNQFQAGNVLEAVGFIAPGVFAPVIEDALIRPATAKLQAEPVSVAPATVLWGDYDARLVRVIGILQSQAFTGTEHILTLLQDGILFGVSLPATKAAADWGQLKKGDRVRATGVCAIQGGERGAPQSFQVLPRSASDVICLPPVRVFSARQVLTIVVVAGAAWGVILLWGMALKRRVREQTTIIRSRLEKEIAMEKRYHHLLENAAFPVIIFQRDSLSIRYVNQRAASRLYGSTGRSYSLASECYDSAEALQGLLRDLQRLGQLTEVEMGFRTLDGQRFWALVCANTIEFDQQPAVFLSFSDITRRKQLEDQLREAHKMEGIGQLAGGMAHEFNNILAAMMLNLGMVQANSSLDVETQQSLEGVAALSKRAADLIRQLLAFSRKSMIQARPLDLTEVLGGFVIVLRRLVGEHIVLEFTGAKNLPHILADEGMIKQVLMNLCLNARDAMVSGGFLTILLQDVEIDARHANTYPDALAGRFVSLSVSDTGCGMDEGTRMRLFEPFFTTKEVGKGTGLGLATVYGIVKQHRGWTEVESSIGKGTTFRVYFPVCEPTAELERNSEIESVVRRGHGTILLVEDEPAVRKTTSLFLQRAGYRVREAGSGDEALVLWQELDGRIDLLFTDMVMPGGMTGLALSRRLRQDRPALKIIISSGYSADTTPLCDACGVAITYLAKPFSPGALLAAVGGCLAGNNSENACAG